MPTRKQTRRVTAWIYAVVNPVIEALDQEHALLESGNLTWRAYLGRCEMIKPIAEYVDPNQLPNYQTFLSEHSGNPIVKNFDRHDSTVEALNASAQQAFECLTSLGEFLQTAESEMKAYEAARLREQWAPAHIQTELPRFSAEYVIDNIQSLPSHYATSEFWNGFGKKLLVFRNRAEFESLHRATKALQEISARLRQELVDYRLSKSRQYDVPAAPVPGLSLDAE